MKFDHHSITLGVISVIYNYILLNGDLIGEIYSSRKSQLPRFLSLTSSLIQSTACF